jgi:hypothetical protein
MIKYLIEFSIYFWLIKGGGKFSYLYQRYLLALRQARKQFPVEVRMRQKFQSIAQKIPALRSWRISPKRSLSKQFPAEVRAEAKI